MSTSDIVRIIKAQPIDRTARRVIQKGTAYQFVNKSGEILSDTPISVREYPANSRPEHNISGQRFDRFTVIGLARDHNSSWVVRCDCGQYTLRKAKVLKSHNKGRGGYCGKCDHLEQTKRGLTSHGIHSKALRLAGMDMYLAIKEALKHGLTPAVKNALIEAVAIVENYRPPAIEFANPVDGDAA